MNWGWKLALVYTTFVLAIVGLVYASSQKKVDLVVQDYYQQELQYSKRMNAIQAANALSAPIAASSSGAKIVLTFPPECLAEVAVGSIRLYRPSGSSADQVWSLALNESGVQELEVAHSLPGYYIVKIDWRMNNKEFYSEQSIYLMP